MTRRRVFSLVAVAAALAGLALAVPGSPAYLPDLLVPPGQYHNGHSTRYWVRALDSPDPDTRRQAVFALGAIGPAAGESVPALARILRQDPDRGARIQAALALSKMTPASRGAVPELAAALEDGEPFVRMNAAIALFRLRADSRPAVPALVKALRDEANQTNMDTFTFTIQEMLALALGRASAGSADGLPALTAALRAAETDAMRKAVARALGEVGAEARPAAAQLRELLKDKDSEVRRAAEESLAKIGGPAPDGGTARAGAADPELPEDQRQYLWEIEHHGNLLVKYGFGPLADALKKADGKALSRLLAADFRGSDLDRPRRVRAPAAYARVERLDDAGRPPRPLDREAFVRRLLEFRKVFTTPPQVKLALMTLRPTVRGRLDGAWEGTAQLRMNGEQSPGAPAEAVLMLRYEVPRPSEEALSRPGWLRSAGLLGALDARAPHYLFAEVARQRGLDATKLHDNWKSSTFSSTPGGVFVCDFDRDGFLDVLITDVNGCALYRGGPGGKFTDVTARCGLPREPVQHPVAAWVDIDGDGWEDLLLAGRVYRNEEGRRFADYTERSNLRLPGDITGIVVADYDRDGKLDLYLTRPAPPGESSWLEGRGTGSRGNTLLRNEGDWQFRDVTRASGASGRQRSTFTAAWLDADNDGWPDLHVINEFGDGVLLVNNRDGTFSEHALSDRPADFGSMGLAAGDIDNDGNIDLFCANMYSKAGNRVIGNLAADAFPAPVMEKMRRFVAGSQLHLNRGGLKFEQAGKRMQVAGVGWSYGACLADLDNDGWLDVFATAGFVSRSRDEPDG